MDSGITLGLICGLVALIIGTIINKSTKKKVTNGELRHGVFLLVLAIACLTHSLLAVWVVFYDNDVQPKTGDLVAALVLLSGFGIAALACFAEYFKVKGRFNDSGIEFYTPWAGAKKEYWDDLISVKFNTSMYWYTLHFKSGNKVRLSSYLLGHGEVLELLKSRGFDL